MTRTLSGRPRDAAARRSGVDAKAAGPWRGLFAEALGPAPRRVLDVGCGDGGVSFLLFALGHYPQGIDRSPETVRRARDRARARCAAVPFHVGFAEDLDFAAEAFDAVVARDLLETLPQPEAALAEWFRVLKPGGVVVVAETRTPPDGRFPAAERLRAAGFDRIVTRAPIAPAGRGRTETPWYRRLTSPAAPSGAAAWGARP
jgi:ubiquinone/menaquinone biosynthesis C-methylase UbiE